MIDNPYAPPTSNVDASTPNSIDEAEVPALWNPDAAANWCLVFSLAFGAYLHMKNWQALGCKDKAASAKTWFIVGLVWLLWIFVSSFFDFSSPVFTLSDRALGLGLLISWYISAAREQARYVKGLYGRDYPRKAWMVPFLCGFGIYLVLFLVGFGAAMVGEIEL